MIANMQADFRNKCLSSSELIPIDDFLSDEERDFLLSHSVLLEYKKGETICKQGAFASNIMFLESGLVKIKLEGQSRDIILSIVSAKHYLGLETIFNNNTSFIYTVTTYTPSTVRMMDINIVRQLLQSNAAFAYRIITLLNETSFQTYNRFYSLTRKQLHGRLADILLCLSNKIFKSPTFDLPLSRADLGELTSMSTESVIRLMKEFKDDGLIDMKAKTIILQDIPRLQRISDLG